MTEKTTTEDRGSGARPEPLDRKLQHNADLEREAADRERQTPTESQIDDAIEDSFPASDPPAHGSPAITPGGK